MLLLPSPRPGLVDAPRCCAARWPARQRRRAACCSAAQLQGNQQRAQAVSDLLRAIEGTDRGVNTSAEQRQSIFRAIDALEALPAGADGAADHTGNASVSATWKLLWTTEKVLLQPSSSSVPKWKS